MISASLEWRIEMQKTIDFDSRKKFDDLYWYPEKSNVNNFSLDNDTKEGL